MVKSDITKFIKKAETSVVSVGTKFMMKAKKNSPEILMVVGLATGAAAVVMACVASTKVNDILAETNETIERIHEMQVEAASSENVVVEEKAVKKALTAAYIHCGVEMAKLYAPAAGVGAISVTSILASNNILKKRNVALSAAYAAVDKGFKDYRKRVVQRFGETVDQELRYGLQSKTVEEVSTDENGNVIRTEKTADVVDQVHEEECLRIFDKTCKGWGRDLDYNLMMLRGQQNFANDKLRSRGYIYLNEVCEMISIPTTKAGQIIGWVYNSEKPNGDNYVDFRMRVVDRPIDNDPANGYEQIILLDFNADGNILDLMDAANLDK